MLIELELVDCAFSCEGEGHILRICILCWQYFVENCVRMSSVVVEEM